MKIEKLLNQISKDYSNTEAAYCLSDAADLVMEAARKTTNGPLGLALVIFAQELLDAKRICIKEIEHEHND